MRGQFGPALSRLREYSCDRHGAYLCPSGASGLVLLASGRHTEHVTDVEELVRHGVGRSIAAKLAAETKLSVLLPAEKASAEAAIPRYSTPAT